MTTPKTRATQGLQTRDFTAPIAVREDSEADGMIVAGIGVPYEDEVELWPGTFESIAAGAVAPRDHRMLFWRHDDPIGSVISESDEADGWHHESRISDTPTGREAYTLAKDGVVRKFSIGFYPVEWETSEDEDGVHIRHTVIDVVEVSLVPIPAYDGAELSEVRHHNPTAERNSTMTVKTPELDELTAQVRSNSESLEDIGRKVELLGAPAPRAQAHPLDAFPSLGAFVRAVATGNEEAAKAYAALQARDFEGGTIAGDYSAPKRTWIGAALKLVEDKQLLTNYFNYTKDLPAEGTSVEYGKITTDTTNVTVQATEGTDLTFGKVSIGSAFADVKTLGGWSALSRQIIERSSINVLDLHWRALIAKYGRAVELLTRGTFTTAYTAASAAPELSLGVALADATPTDFLRLILDANDAFDADPMVDLAGFLVSRDVFLALAEVDSTKKMLVVKNRPEDGAAGTISVSIPSADLYDVEVRPVPNWTGEHMAAVDRNAIRTQVSPGAPWQLQEDGIINLTRSFSVYGYATSFAELPTGIKAVDLTGV